MKETKNITDSSEELGFPNLPTSMLPRKHIDLVTSTSMNLIDDSAQHLHGLMRGLHANQPPAEIKGFDPDRVMTAVAIADEIHKMLRLKLDVIRLQMKYKVEK